MTRKSAASVKAVKTAKDALPPIEDIFKIMREGYLTVLETNIETAKRVDNLFNIRDLARRYWGDDDMVHNTIEYYKSLYDLSVGTYEKILEIAKERYTFEELSNMEMNNWYDEILPSVEEIITKEDMIKAMIVFLSIKPYGEKMLRDHNQFQEELMKREANNE